MQRSLRAFWLIVFVICVLLFKVGFLFFSALGPRSPNFIVTVSRNRWIWPEWSIKNLYKNVAIFKNTAHIINRRLFRVLFVRGTFSTLPFINSGIGIVASIKTTNIKVCMFRGLSRDFIKVWNWDIPRACATEKLLKCYK